MSSDIPIGILHSLDGPMASSECMLIDAALLAVNEINAQGGYSVAKCAPMLVKG